MGRWRLRALAAAVRGRRTRWMVIGAWVLVALALAPLQPRLQDAAADENEAFLVGRRASRRASTT